MVLAPPVLGQIDLLDRFERPGFVSPPLTNVSPLDVGTIYLDGRPVFSITAPRPSSKGATSVVSPIKERVRLVERQLISIARSILQSEQLQVDYEFDAATTVVDINGQYLMTLTAADANAYGLTQSAYSSLIRSAVTDALSGYYHERQPSARRHQLVMAFGSLVGTILGFIGFRIWQKYVVAKRTSALSQFDDLAPLPSLDVNGELSEAEQAEWVAQEQEYKAQRDQISRIKFKADLWTMVLRSLRVGLCISFVTYSLSLFPESRWIASVLLSRLFLTIVQILGILLGAYLLTRLSLLGIDYGYSLLRAGQRLSSKNTVRSLLRLQTLRNYSRSVVIFLLTVVTVLVILQVIGLDLAPLLAGAGILGIAISFGAQNLIKDVINGLFLLWEDQFGLGDVISIDGVTGLVESMNLRMTQLRSQDGDLISIPNGNIQLVKNHSNQWSRANLAIQVAYHTDLSQAMDIIEKTARALRFDPRWSDDILEDPNVLGVDDLGDNSITIRLWIKTKPLRQWDISREFRQRIKEAFEEVGISIPFPQRTIWVQDASTMAMTNQNEDECC